jgi:hypothetical protein
MLNLYIYIILLSIIFLSYIIYLIIILTKEDRNRTYIKTFFFTTYGLRNESFYIFLLDFIINYYNDFHIISHLTITFIEYKDNRLINLSNDCKIHLRSTRKINIDSLYSEIEWSESAFNNEYDYIIVKLEIKYN